jgi:hypothetical protein
MGSHLNAVALIGVSGFYHLYKKRIKGEAFLLLGLLFIVFPFVFAVTVSNTVYPIFELRFFSHLSVYFCLMFTLYTFKLLQERTISRKIITLTFLISTFAFTFYQRGVLQAANAPDVQSLFKAFPKLSEKVVLSCGNCPSFYFDDDKIQCLRGWDFSLESHKNPELRPEVFILFKRNEWFCKKQAPQNWQEYDFPELKVYFRP